MGLRLVKPEIDYRSSDPDTSREGAYYNLPGKSATAYQILQVFDRETTGLFWKVGLTAKEVEVQHGFPKAHKRISELLRDGLLELVTDDQGHTKKRAYLSPTPSRVLRISSKGKAYLRSTE